MNKIYFGDCLDIIEHHIPVNSVDMIYIDPPFNTGITQTRKLQKSIRGVGNIGFGGHNYTQETLGTKSYLDNFGDNYLDWLLDRCKALYYSLKETGNFIIHLDYREVHYVKVMLDELFGREHFLNEIIWAWDYGAKSKTKFPAKHNTLLWYTKSDGYYFDADASDRIEYLAPKLVGDEKAERGKFPTDVWWGTIVPTNGKEKTGYPTQKPEWLLTRLISVACPVGGLVVDCFAGSGTTGAVAEKLDRNYVLCDNNLEAIETMRYRLPTAEFINLE